MRRPIILKEDSQNGSVKAFCPFCNEELEVTDLEMFFACPFCGGALEDNDDLQQFILSPSVQNWLSKSMKSLTE
jgi:hypothetical protein